MAHGRARRRQADDPRPTMFSFCVDGCVNCEPVRKRPRRSAGPPVRFAVECVVDNGQPRAAEPLFLLERLAHIRCFTLTLCGPEGARLLGVSVRVTGSVAEVLCELAPVDGVHASVSEQRFCLRLDVCEPLDAAAATTMSLADGYAYIRLPLLADTAGVLDRDPTLGGAQDLGTRSAGSGADLQDRRIGRDLREEAGLLGRAAGLLRQERKALRGAMLCCEGCGDELLLLPQEDPWTLPHPDATSWVDFVQCCQDLSFDWACVFPPEKAQSAFGHTVAAAATPPGGACLIGECALLLGGAPPPTTAARGEERAAC